MNLSRKKVTNPPPGAIRQSLALGTLSSHIGKDTTLSGNDDAPQNAPISNVGLHRCHLRALRHCRSRPRGCWSGSGSRSGSRSGRSRGRGRRGRPVATTAMDGAPAGRIPPNPPPARGRRRRWRWRRRRGQLRSNVRYVFSFPATPPGYFCYSTKVVFPRIKS